MSNTDQKQEGKPNGVISRVLQFGQMLVLAAVLPWGVWVTGQIYGLAAGQAQLEQWKMAREKTSVATMTDVELARLKVKDELMQTISLKLDAMMIKLNDVDVKLTRHEAATSKP